MNRLNEEMISTLNDDALAEIAMVMLAEADVLRDNAGLARYELARRLKDRDATHVDTEHWSGRLVPTGYRHVVEDIEGLRDALAAAGVTGERLDDAVGFPTPAPPALLVNHRALNELLKLGGDVRAAIERHRLSTPGEPKLELVRKAAVEVEA